MKKLLKRCMKSVVALCCSTLLFTSLHAQVSGTKKIGGVSPDYPTVAAAVTALNSFGVGSGGVKFLVAAGHREVASNIQITASGNIFDTIQFVKTGTGANPIITAAPGTGTRDGVFVLNGTDYIVFDGIEVRDTISNIKDTTRMEWGFAVLRNSASNGSENVIIRNCTVTLQKANVNSIGIFAGNHIPSDSATLSGTGTNSWLSIINNTISNTYWGISVVGSTTAYDSTVRISRNNISNFGGGTKTANAINVFGQKQFIADSNIISGGTQTKGQLYGIYTMTGSGLVSILYNTISLTGDSSTWAVGIMNNMGNISSNINLNNNRINNSVSSGTFYGIQNTILSNSFYMLNDSVNLITLKGGGNFLGLVLDASFQNKSLCRIGKNYVGQITGTSGTAGGMIGLYIRANSITVDSNTITGFNCVLGDGNTSDVMGIFVNCKAYNLSGIIDCFGNTISDFNSTGSFAYVTGINISADVSNTFGNRIYGLKTGFSVFGINSKQGTQNMYQNKIYNLYSSSNRDDYGDGMNNAGSIGIYSYSGSRNIHNNLIGKLNAPASAYGKDVAGITIDAGTDAQIYYNTIYLDCQNITSGNFGSSVIYISQYTSAFTFRNNIFVNTSSGNAAIYRLLDGSTLAKMTAQSNCNLFYPGTPASNHYYMQGGGNAQTTMATFKQAIGPSRDSISYSQFPTFMDTTGNTNNYLRLDTAVATYIESGAANLAGFIKDFYTDSARYVNKYPLTGQVNGGGTKPDMGAYEGDYKKLPAITFLSDSTIQLTGDAYRNVPRQGILGVRIVTKGLVGPLTVTSFSFGTGATTAIGDISNARLYYTASQNFMDTTRVFGSGTPNTAGYIINGNMQLVADTNYFWLTYDVATNAAPTNIIDATWDGFVLSSGAFVPTYPNPAGNKIIPTPLSGSRTVGTTGNYATLTSAINTLNLYGVSGPFTLNLIDTVYNQAKGEVFPLTINAVPGLLATDSILIRPAATVNARIVSGGTAVFILNGADNIKIEGSNNGTNTRNLNLNVTSGTGIWFQNTAAGDSCVNNTFRNLIIDAGLIGIGCGTSSIGTSSVGTKHNNNGIVNCKITAGSMGIYLRGSSATVLNKNNYITDNELQTSGIMLGFEDNIIISRNKILNITASTFGLSLGISTFTSYAPAGNMVTNARVSSNEIGPVVRANSASFGICVAPATAGTNIFDNNLIYGVTGSGTTTGRMTAGIYIGGGAGCITKVYFNTVHMSGATTRSTPSAYAIAIGGANPVIDLKNNIFYNAQTSSSTTSNSYAFGYNSPTFVGLTASNNLLYTAGSNSKFAVTGAIGINTAGTIQSTLTALQTATGQHSSSLDFTPDLDTASAGQYKPRILQVITSGVPVAGFDTDRKGNLRNSSNPSMGALEVIPVFNDVGIASVKAENTEMRVVIRNYGYNFVGNLSVGYKINNGATVTQSFSVSLNTFDTTSVLFSPFTIPGGINTIKVFTRLPNGNADTVNYNDTMVAPLTFPLSGTYTIGGVNPNYSTIDSAVRELNARGVKGPVTFNIRTGTYTAPFTIQTITGASDTSRITFTSQAAHVDSVNISYKASGSGNNFIAQLNAASFITFRKLTFTARDTTYSNAILLMGDASSNIIENCNITSGYGQNLQTTGVCIYSTSFSGKNNIIRNNKLLYGNFGIQLYGFSDIPIGIMPPNNNLIEGNDIRNNRYGSVEISNAYNQAVRNNIISTLPTMSGTYNAIRLINCDSLTEITGNSIKYNTNGQSSGIILDACDGTTTASGKIINNVICLTNTSSLRGIYLTACTRQRILHNSVNIKGNGTGAAAAYIETNGSSTAIMNIEVFNNVFANTGGGLAMAFPLTNISLISDDYNNIYSTGSTLMQNTLYKNLSSYFRGLGVAYPKLDSLRKVSIQAKYSLSYAPGFTNDSNLVPNPADSASWSLSGRGNHLDSLLVGKDFNGVRRPAVPSEGVPDLGAYEFKPTSVPPIAKATPVIPNPGDTQIFMFAEDTVAKIIWDQTTAAPASVKVRLYTGVTPQGITAPNNIMYTYIKADVPANIQYQYRVKTFFQPEWTGTIATKANLQLTTFTVGTNWIVDAGAITDNIAGTFTSSPLTSIGAYILFTGTDKTAPLPVTLTYLSAEKSGKDVVLHWATASEINSDRFEIERSYNNKNFENAGSVDAAGNSSKSLSYVFTDRSPFVSGQPVIYYRLKMIDNDGKYVYSNIAVVDEQRTENQQVVVYPNPFSDHIAASVVLTAPSQVTMSIIDITGKTIYTGKVSGGTGSNTFNVDTDKLDNGLYFMVLEYNGTKTVQKIIRR
jgi:hypothetical protein